MILDGLITECSDYDFKEDLEVEKPKSWLKTVSAFANGFGGSLFFGVTNEGKRVGLSHIKETQEAISQLINRKISPLPSYNLNPFSDEGREFLEVRVRPGVSTPYYYSSDGNKEAYVRMGSQSVLANDDILNELILKGTNKTFDSVVTSYEKKDYSFNTLEATFYDKTLTRFTPEDYVSFGLVTRKGFLTNAGVLFADQTIFRQSRIFCTHWNGKTKAPLDNDALDDKEISGSIVNQLLRAMDFVDANTKKPWRKEAQGRVEMPDYDFLAVREALVNGIIHRLYTQMGSEVSLDIYQDRLEVTSPGLNPSEEKLERVIDVEVTSVRRNPIIADLFARMHFMDRRGSGLKKITDQTNALFHDGKNHVEYVDVHGFFRVIIQNANYVDGVEIISGSKNGDVTQNVTQNVTQKVAMKNSQRSNVEIVKELIRQNPKITKAEMAQKIGLTPRTIVRLTKKEGSIHHIGPSKGGHWVIDD